MSILRIREIKAMPQDHVEDIIVVAETDAKNVSVDMLELLEGAEALEYELLDLQTLGYRGRCWAAAQHAHSTPTPCTPRFSVDHSMGMVIWFLTHSNQNTWTE